MSEYSYVQLTASWTKVKSCHVDHGNHINWTDLGSEYVIVVTHRPFEYLCTIEKTDPKNADQIDFEDNYKE